MPSRQAHRLTRSHQAELAALGALVEREVRRIAATAQPADVDAWWRRVVDDLVALVAAAWRGSAVLAERYLVEHARIEGVAVTPTVARWVTERALTSLRVTGPVSWKSSYKRTGSEAAASRAMAESLSGAAQRLALSGARDTVDATVRRSRRIVGWRRVADEDPCAFCAMLASRGAVYKSRAVALEVGRSDRIRGPRRAGQAYHDNDQCVAEPLYVGEDEPEWVDELYQQWLEVTGDHYGAAKVDAWRRYWDSREAGEDGAADSA